MSFGTGGKRNSNLKAFSFKVKVKGGDGKYLVAPVFEVSRREGEKFVSNTEAPTATRVSGALISIGHKEYEWKGPTGKRIIQSVNLALMDKDEIYFVTIPYSYTGFGILNSLLNLKTFENVDISLYQTKARVEGGKSYAAGSVWQNDQKVEWKFKKEELPPVTKVKFQGKDLSDLTAVVAFFAAQIKELGKVVKNQTPVVPNHGAAPTPPAEDAAGEVENEKDPIPF